MKYLANSFKVQTSTIIAIFTHCNTPIRFFKISGRSVGSLL